jgi:enamine deaminase RidA (YjgF/YER057c/UK114 family)
MKKRTSTLAALLGLCLAQASSACASPVSSASSASSIQPSPPIQRIKSSNPQSPILLGALVPSGASLFYLSGQVPDQVDATKPKDDPKSYGDTKTQTLSVLTKIKAALEAQKLSLSDVVKLTVYLVGDPEQGGKMDFKGFSEAYAQHFGTQAQPNIVARSTVQVAALANPAFLVEIEATAAKTP